MSHTINVGEALSFSSESWGVPAPLVHLPSSAPLLNHNDPHHTVLPHSGGGKYEKLGEGGG